MQELYIDTPDGVRALCNRLGGTPWLAVDTEFLRERTYYPRLCLIQIANTEVAACIDPLTIDDLSPLRNLLLNPAILKVFHAARQDLEILYQLWDAVPAPVFDTQIAATLLGLGDQAGYANVVEQLLGISLPKEHSRTDWTRRPLSGEQRRYALDDVIYLGRLYQEMHARLTALGRIEWLGEDFRTLTESGLYRVQPEHMWQRIRGRQRLKGVQLAVLRTLAAWREEEAMKANRPRKWIMKDEVLLDLARRRPASLEKLGHIRGLERGDIKRHGHHLLRLIGEAVALPPEAWPETEKAHRPTPQQEALTDLLMAVLRLRAEAHQLASGAVASRKDLERLVAGARDIPLLRGWRHGLVGADLERVLAGKQCVCVSADRLELVARSAVPPT